MGFFPDLAKESDIKPELRRLATENLNLFRLRGGAVSLDKAPVYYDRRRDGNYYANYQEILSRGWADCDGFTGWLLAELWYNKIPAEPDLKYQGRYNGKELYHVFVRVLDRGKWLLLDPSVWKGMR